ncbi:MAG: hypothetical protein SPM04_00250, partial [Lachnospira sp.]|nr:hypothetical protein [Lachnospira sp.]
HLHQNMPPGASAPPVAFSLGMPALDALSDIRAERSPNVQGWLWLEIARALLLQGFQALEPAVSRLQRLFKYNFRPVSDYLRPLKPGMKQEDFGCREEKNHREI